MNTLDEKLRRLFTHERPFGPTNADNINDYAAFEEILDENNKIYGRNVNSNPSIIIGRRGSGKTSFMRKHKKHGLSEDLSAATSFSEVVGIIQKRGECQFYEIVADIWEQFIYLAIFRAVASKFKLPSGDLSSLRDFNAKHGIRDTGNIDQMLWRLVHAAQASEIKAISAAALLLGEVAGVDFLAAKESAINILKHNKSTITLLIDSVEKYPFHAEKMEYVVGGLLQCVGEFNERNEYVNVRLALPAELYQIFKRYAPNPEKNFGNDITLHWHASELLSIAAHRLSIYMRLYHTRYWVSLPSTITDNPHVFLEQILPETITNGLGTIESTIPYLLRHTQLMPRHLLRYLNSICGPIYRDTPESALSRIKEDDVINGIRHAEDNLALEVFSAYKDIHPALEVACEDCIPKLPLKFSDGTLIKTFNYHGKKRTHSLSYIDFKRMLMEAGVVGVFDRETERYFTANFEYTARDKLMDNGGPYCLHPIFAVKYNCIKNSSDSKKPIYPFGSDPNAADYRELRENA